MLALTLRKTLIMAVAPLGVSVAAYAAIPEIHVPIEPYVERLAIAGTALSLMVTPVIYFLQKIHENDNERSRASGSLYLELDDAFNGLDEKMHGNLRAVFLDNRIYYFTNRLLNHDFYDSLVNSGKITFIRPELQQIVQDVFQRIKDRNRMLRKIRELQETGAEPMLAYGYYEGLAEHEEYLIANLPNILQRLKNEYGIQ